MNAFNIAVGIPTVGRATVIAQTLAQLGKQVRAPEKVIVCGTKSADVEGAGAAWPGSLVLLASAGLPRQRNVVIANAVEADILVFFDDDFLPAADYLAAVESHMAAFPRTVVATGTVVADGINGPGLSVPEGLAILAQDMTPTTGAKPTFAAYGCNMAVRLAPLREHGLRFDERLPLYGWQEDVDLSRQLAGFGDIMQLSGARGVHLGTKLGRGSGMKLGYSQVANPIYLSSKRRGYPLGRAISHIASNMAMNAVRSVWSEPYVDRRGRLRGNARALCDLVAGRMLPERILDL
ncbi:MAG TPA: glycosyltransferase family 2 protein [Acetobacteraceae bacterium]|nr:glycosyltransferase family 2 protein [Acetobacteraceae bacterium]